MARIPPDVTDTELAMLQVLWKEGRATRRQITDSLYPDGETAHYATVQKLLERLEAKGYVKHTRHEGVLVFTSLVDRDELIRRRLREVAAKLCDGAITPLVMNLVRSEPLTLDELNELQGFLDEHRRRAKGASKAN